MRVLVEQDFVTPDLETGDIMIFQCGCACKIEALSHPGMDNTLAYHMVSCCRLQVYLEVGTTYDTEEYDILSGYETVYTAIAYSHETSQEDEEASAEALKNRDDILKNVRDHD